MRAVWLLTLCSASSWLFLISTFTPADISTRSPFVFLLATGVLAAAISLRKLASKPFPGIINYLALPLLFICLLIPFPYNLGAYLALAGISANLLRPGKYFAPLSGSMMLTGFMLLVQSACMPLFYVIASRVHEIKLLNILAYPFLRLLGLNPSMSENVLYFSHYNVVSAFPGTLEKLGFYLFFLLYPVGLALIGMFDGRLKRIAQYTGICLGYLLARYVFMIFVFAQVDNVSIFWEPYFQILSYLPLAIILYFYMPLQSWSMPSGFLANLPSWKKAVPSFALFFLSIFCFVGIWSFNDSGIRKDGRILIDEVHSDWEWSMKKFDTTWFGSQSTYNYYCMSEFFNHFYSVDYNTEKQLDSELLSQYDILIIKTPTKAFAEDEIDAIVKFVDAGGGLWLIGDHTNVFGMDYYLNFIAKKFGLFFHYDSTYDLDSGKLSFYKRPKVLPHPIVQNMPPFLFATSDTISAPLFAENAMIGYGLRSRLLNYAGRAFFEDKPSQDYEFGLFLQSVALKYGKGRVAAFSDSTCFSNFYMFITGKPELALGTVEWLNRANRMHFLPWVFALISVAALLGGFKATTEKRSTKLLICFFALLLAVPLSISFFSHLTSLAYPLPIPHTPYKKINFETEHSDFTLPDKRLVDKHPKNIHTFFVWTQRMDYVPSLQDKLVDSLQAGTFTVIFNPTKPFGADEIESVSLFVKNGGRLLLVDGPQNINSTANQLLKEFQLNIEYATIGKSAVVNEVGDKIGFVQKSGIVSGGKAYLRTEKEQTVFAVKKVGKGAVGVMADSSLFANPTMGGTQIKPSPAQQMIYKMEFYILRMMEQAI